MDSQQTTAAPSQPLPPRQRQAPIYLPLEELGHGEFGIVHKVIDVSTETIYAGKYFYLDKRNKWKTEVEILENVSPWTSPHVSMTVSPWNTIV
jgi:hypothetical protein